MAYQSKYTGAEVEHRLDKTDDIPYSVSELDNDVGYITKDSADNSYEKKGSIDQVNLNVSNLSTQVNQLQDKIESLDKEDINWIDVK